MGLIELTERQSALKTWQKYACSLATVAFSTVLGLVFLHHVSPTNIVMLYLLAVVISGLLWGQGPAVASSVVGVLAFDFFIVPPQISLSVENAEYLITFVGLLSVASVIGTLTGRLRDRALALQLRERESSALFSFIRVMVAVDGIPAIAEAAVNHVSESLDRPATLAWAKEGLGLSYRSSVGCDLSPEEVAALEGSLSREDGRPCEGLFSPQANLECVGFATAYGLTGILAVESTAARPLDRIQKHLLEAFAAQAATMVERAQLLEAAHRAEMLEEAERLHDALLNSVSHALRTPLASIIGGLSALADPTGHPLDPALHSDLIETAKEEAERLNLIVRDLLDMTRLQSGHLRLNLDWYDLEDVIGAALAQAQPSIRDHPIRVQIPDDPLLVRLDQVLIVQVLDNLLQNACKYSDPGSPVEVRVKGDVDCVAITVADRGPGLSPADAERVFEKFYRVAPAGSGTPGSGLGLAICKGIVEAHHGKIWTSERQGGGTELTFILPMGSAPTGGGEHDRAAC